MSAAKPTKTGLKTVRPVKAPAQIHELPGDQLGPAAQYYRALEVV